MLMTLYLLQTFKELYAFLYTVSLFALSVCLSPIPPLFIKQIKSLLAFKISVRGLGRQSGKQNTVQSHVYSLDYSLPPPP